MGSPVADLVRELLAYFIRSHDAQANWEHVAVHDAVTVASVIDPVLVETDRMHVAVETRGEYSYGETVCGSWELEDRPLNTDVGVGADREQFVELLFGELARY